MSDLTTIVGRHFVLKDKKFTSKFFIFRMWLGYGLDGAAIAIAWMEFGFYFISSTWWIVFIAYLALLVAIGIILTTITGWKDASGKPDNYKWVKYAMGYFKLTALVNATFVFFQVFSSGRRDVGAVSLLTVTGIDMAMNFVEMAASFAGFECNEINPSSLVDKLKDDVKTAFDPSETKADEVTDIEANKGGKKIKKKKREITSETQKVKQTTEQEAVETKVTGPKGKLPALKSDSQKSKVIPIKNEPKTNTPKKKPDPKKTDIPKTDPKKSSDNPKFDSKKNENSKTDSFKANNSPRKTESSESKAETSTTKVNKDSEDNITTDPVKHQDVNPTTPPIGENATDMDKSALSSKINESNIQDNKSTEQSNI